MAKGQPKTMRFDEEVELYIEAYHGENFSDKFHNLCRYFMKKEEELDKQINLLEWQIASKQMYLEELKQAVINLSGIKNSIDDFQHSFNSVVKSVDTYLEKCNT
ncbi:MULTISPECIES: hypothetical protein [Dehalobacter]|uniref:hypothetical protein n=1 Tax=Dehalobacter TaxID=56112 RepID=UPI0002EF3B22|nr:hypothetical protein [Dehalobacter sp.]MDJ0304559.1 hypothetical protein [Dehalobacter sp.]